VHVGLVIACASALPFAFNFLLIGSALAVAGVAVAAIGIIIHRQKRL
jgi:hypothetical protein